jgi:hypothetical protein
MLSLEAAREDWAEWARRRTVHRMMTFTAGCARPHFPGEGRDPCMPWAPAFAGVAEIWYQPWSAFAE